MNLILTLALTLTQVSSLPAAAAPAPARSYSAGFAAREAERDVEEAGAFGVRCREM